MHIPFDSVMNALMVVGRLCRIVIDTDYNSLPPAKMHVPVVAVLVMAALLPEGSWALPSGAPSSACATIAPIFHAGSSQDLNSSPYTLNISALSGGYVPGNTYMCMYINLLDPVGSVRAILYMYYTCGSI